jgi:hypothetical protein
MYQALPSVPVSSSMKNKVLAVDLALADGVGLLYSANETPGVAMSRWDRRPGRRRPRKARECGGKTVYHRQTPVS